MTGTMPWVHAAALLRNACGVVALVGLFAMHGLTAHGAAHAGHDVAPAPTAAAVAAHDDCSDCAGMTAVGTGAPSPVTGERSPGGGLSGLAGLCLAVLLVGVVAAALRGRLVRLRRLPDPVAADGRPARSLRDRDPPCLFALSIQRC